ncbi:unnamed protein product [Rotaria magnacalcarata]
MKKPIVLAQYPIIGHDKTLLNCVLGKFVIDTTIRERFSKRLVDEIDISSSSMLNYVEQYSFSNHLFSFLINVRMVDRVNLYEYDDWLLNDVSTTI